MKKISRKRKRGEENQRIKKQILPLKEVKIFSPVRCSICLMDIYIYIYRGRCRVLANFSSGLLRPGNRIPEGHRWLRLHRHRVYTRENVRWESFRVKWREKAWNKRLHVKRWTFRGSRTPFSLEGNQAAWIWKTAGGRPLLRFWIYRRWHKWKLHKPQLCPSRKKYRRRKRKRENRAWTVVFLLAREFC